MPEVRIGSGNFFSQGLDGVTHLASFQTNALPEQHELAPAEQTQRPQVNDLLTQPTMESRLEEAIRPSIGNPNLLLPTNFQKVRESLMNTLAQAAEAIRGKNQNSAKAINSALRLLTDENDLRQLLHEYRTSLHRG